MDGVDHHHHNHGRSLLSRRRSRTLKERLGWRGMGCCGGSTWGFRPTTATIINGTDTEEEDEDQQHHQLQLLQGEDQQQLPTTQYTPINASDPGCSSPAPDNSSRSHSMNLAAALAAERQFRAVEGTNLVDVSVGNSNSDSNTGPGSSNVGPRVSEPGTPLRVSLMRLLAETDGGEGEDEKGVAGVGGGGNDTVCCVCMIRKKGAAFIPCGHTFCRVCSREVWLNRGSCPLCNRSILEILDIF